MIIFNCQLILIILFIWKKNLPNLVLALVLKFILLGYFTFHLFFFVKDDSGKDIFLSSGHGSRVEVSALLRPDPHLASESNLEEEVVID